ncbi:MAG: malate dehydrogenase [Actinobacteria bacterium]|nr:malate dehydrogenase [Actinomycetota bacterium]
MAKVTVVGAGNVGATCAHSLLRLKLADVVLIDIDEGLTKGKALDLSQAGVIEGFTDKITGGSDYRASADSDVVVVTAGLPRRPGMSREELLDKNARIICEVIQRSLDTSPEATIIVLTNPLDLMAYLAYRVSGLDAQRVIGMGGVLDTARFKRFIASEVGVNPADVEAMVIGAHSDSMVPLASLAKVDGKALTSLISPDARVFQKERTKGGGAEIVSHLKQGSAFYAPGAAAAHMVGAILLGDKRITPASVFAGGAYGIDGLYIGLPVTLDLSGVLEIVELQLSPVEQEALLSSAKEIEAGLTALGRWFS